MCRRRIGRAAVSDKPARRCDLHRCHGRADLGESGPGAASGSTVRGLTALRVVFADDNYLVREGVAALLAEVDDVELVETATEANSLLKAVETHRPDAVLTDIGCRPR